MSVLLDVSLMKQDKKGFRLLHEMQSWGYNCNTFDRATNIATFRVDPPRDFAELSRNEIDWKNIFSFLHQANVELAELMTFFIMNPFASSAPPKHKVDFEKLFRETRFLAPIGTWNLYVFDGRAPVIGTNVQSLCLPLTVSNPVFKENVDLFQEHHYSMYVEGNRVTVKVPLSTILQVRFKLPM